MYRSNVRTVAMLLGGMFLLAGAMAAPALAALPAGYQVQRIDTPLPTANAGFGNASISTNDTNGDGVDDFAVLQHSGTEQNGAGTIWLFSGATGQVLRNVNAGDDGGTRGNAGADNYIGRMSDLGSCANAPQQVAGQPGPTCASATVGPPDGVLEILIGAGGVDVGGIPDVGRGYVLDGKTLAILKKIDMPAADRALIAARIAENPLPATATAANLIRGGFGRTVTNPRGLPPCAGNSGIGACPAAAQMPTGVRIGDVDGGGVGDIVIGANQFPENGATAHPDSDCAARAGTATCQGAGRTYVYRGENIAGSNPAAILETPLMTLKNIGAQVDDPFSGSGGHVNENFGHSQIPIGDVGTCQIGGTFPAVVPGQRCLRTSRTNVPDGKPDFVVSTHRSECPLFEPDYAFFECGASILFDGATGAILYIYNHPEPQANALFGFTTGQQFPVGDLGDSNLPDVVIPAMQNANDRAEAGRGYVFSGNVGANMINFAFVDDPTPNTFGRFANPTEGVGDLVGGTQVRNEVLAGQFSAVQTGGKADTNFDVSFVNPANEQALQTISDPDAQPESGFGSRLFPIGDLNNDGMLDFGVSSVRWDQPASGGNPAVLDAGRLYIFRSDANAVAPPPPPLPAGPAGPAGPEGPAGASTPGTGGGTTTAAALAGRTVDLDASRTRVSSGARVRLRGVVEAFANPQGCEAGQSVRLQQRTLTGSRFRTFRTVRTSSRGSFQTPLLRMTSTRLYRARVSQTDACEGAQSPRERVTVLRARAAVRAAAIKRARSARR